MPSIITNKLKEFNIRNLIKSVTDDSLYISFGKVSDWTNVNAPDVPVDTYNLYDFFKDQLYMKRLTSGNVSRVAKYYRWVPNARYQQYSALEHIDTLCEPKIYAPATATASISNGAVSQINIVSGGSGYESTPIVTITGDGTGATAQAIVVNGIVVSVSVTNGGSGYTTATVTISAPRPDISSQTFTVNPYYVVTDDLKVYICISNNNLALSTVKPTSSNTNEPDTGGTALADGYVWKYLYKISQNDAEKFLTPNWLPVNNLAEDDLSDNWDIQFNATENNRIHGSDIPYALNATALMCKVRVTGSEGNAIVSSNDYRKISLIANPIAVNSIYKAAGATANTITLNASHDISNTSAVWYPSVGKKIKILEGPGRGDIRTITAFNSSTKEITVDSNWTFPVTTSSTYGIVLSTQVSNLCLVLTVTAVSGSFVEDDVVTQTSSGATGKLVWYDSVNSKLYLSEVNGTFTTGPITQNAASATVTAITQPDAASYPVDILFTENRKKILRYSDQIEDVKILIQF